MLQVEIEGDSSDHAIMKKRAKPNRVLGSGDIFGEVSLVVNLPRAVTVRARTPVDIFVLSKTNLEETLEDFPVSRDIVARRARERYGDVIDEYERASRMTHLQPSFSTAQTGAN